MTPGPRKRGLELSGGVRSLPQVPRRSAGRRARPYCAPAPRARGAWQRVPLRGAVTGQWRLSALRPLSFLREEITSCENELGNSEWNEANREDLRSFAKRFRRRCVASAPPPSAPAKRGGGPLELAKRANRGGGGAGLGLRYRCRQLQRRSCVVYSKGNEQAWCQRTTATFAQRRVLRPLHHPFGVVPLPRYRGGG